MSKDSAPDKHPLITLTITALGIVYGDIGTSPLYAIRESLGGLPINLADVLGVLSLIVWALIIVISAKYLLIVLRADNNGEGGILALLALIQRAGRKSLSVFFILAIFGAGLLFGDGMLTPAVSVVSAIEGLRVISPALSSWVVPVACLILLLIFLFQSSGTTKIGITFGPVIFLWFVVIAALGLVKIIHNPVVMNAFNPYYAYEFLHINGLRGYALLGGVFLVVTGGEALYADLGHFGKGPIRSGWFFVVLPGLLFNYFGQAAYLLENPSAISNPFYLLAPSWFYIPLLVIATAATIIASQAVISATFSLTQQAVLLGLLPHQRIVQTSENVKGQIYIPGMNFILMIGTLLLVITFKSATSLTHAYGIAVNLDMMLTTILVSVTAYRIWKWNSAVVLMAFVLFFSVDVMFFGANIQKVVTGGWVPILFALICAFVMSTWHKGMGYLRLVYYTQQEALTKILKQLNYRSINRLEGLTAIFITDLYDNSGGTFLNFLKLNRAAPENILILNYQVEKIPYVDKNNRFKLILLEENIYQLTLHYGFMDFISIPQALAILNHKELLPFELDLDKVTYFVDAPNIVATRKKKTLWFFWQEKLFSYLMRNYSGNLYIEFYQLPYNRTVAVGSYCMI